jgi:hypothetical protein
MFGVANCVVDCVRFAIPQPTEWERIGNEIDAAFIFTRADFVKVFEEKAVNVGEACSPTGFESSF